MEQSTDCALPICSDTATTDVPLPVLSHDLENGTHPNNPICNASSVDGVEHHFTDTDEPGKISGVKSIAATAEDDIMPLTNPDIVQNYNKNFSENIDFPVVSNDKIESSNQIEDMDFSTTLQECTNTDGTCDEQLQKLPAVDPIEVRRSNDLVLSADKNEWVEKTNNILTTSGTSSAVVNNDIPSSDDIDFLSLVTTLEATNAKEADALSDMVKVKPALENKDVSQPKETEFLPVIVSTEQNKDESLPKDTNALTLITPSILEEKDVPPTKEKDFLPIIITSTSIIGDKDISLLKIPETFSPATTTAVLEEKDVSPTKEAENIPPAKLVTAVLEDEELSEIPRVVAFPVSTPSFEEIPAIVKTEPAEDIFITHESSENETQHFGKQSETKLADISLITDLEIDFNCCASCKLDFRADPSETPKKLKHFSSFNTVSGEIKTVSILDALLLIFDLRFVKCCTAFHREESLLQEISLCTQCAIMATQMYKLYTEFSELIHAESILSKLVNHENVLQNNAIAKAAPAKVNDETEIKDETRDFSENLPNIRVRNPTEKQRKGVTSIFESDNESEGESHEVVNGLESVRRSSLENKKRINIEKNRRVSVGNEKPVSLNVSPVTISSRLVKPTHFRIKKEHGKVPHPPSTATVVNNVINTKFSQRPKRIFDVKQESFVVQPSRKMSRGNSVDNSVPSIISVHSIANPSIVKDEAQPCSSSSMQRSLRPKRTSCKIVDYSKQLGEESDEVEDDNDKDAEIFSEDEFDDDPHDPDFSKKSKSKTNVIISKCAKKSRTKLSPVEIKRMFDSEKFLKELSLPNLYPLACKICKKTFRDVISLERHKKTHNKTISSFPCIICGIVCWNQNVFVSHLGTHIPEKPFVCDCCNAAFKIKGELDQHKLRHQELIIFTCQQCKECFPSLMLLNRHEAAIHMKETSYICPMCPAVQFERSDWNKHILTHAPFKCTKCDLFFNPNELKVHVQTYHPTQQAQKLQPQPSHSIFSDLLRAAANQRIHH